MQWGHIKTLFILSFLILNIYLLVQFMDKQNDADNGILDNRELAIEDQLKAENITIPKFETEELEKEAYISVSQKKFLDEELQPLTAVKGLQSEVVDQNLLVSELEDPIPVSKNATDEEISNLVKSQILFPDHYTYWGWNEELNILIFFQEIDDRPIYFSQNGLILAYLNEENKITHYTQTMLDKATQQGDLQTLIKPIRSIEVLYNQHYLKSDEEVTNKVVLGYYARLLTEGNQVFAPTWRVNVNGERNYFVNAIEGLVSPENEIEFLHATISSDQKKIEALDDSSQIKASMLAVINKFQIEISE